MEVFSEKNTFHVEVVLYAESQLMVPEEIFHYDTLNLAPWLPAIRIIQPHKEITEI